MITDTNDTHRLIHGIFAFTGDDRDRVTDIPDGLIQKTTVIRTPLRNGLTGVGETHARDILPCQHTYHSRDLHGS